jgi:hypothetical protein
MYCVIKSHGEAMVGLEAHCQAWMAIRRDGGKKRGIRGRRVGPYQPIKFDD